MKKFECSALREEKCSIREPKIYCCFYCPHIRECFKNWYLEIGNYCRILEKDRWCSVVERFIEAHGFGKRGFVFR